MLFSTLFSRYRLTSHGTFILYFFLDHLKESLEDYVKPMEKVKLVRTDQREGLIRARIIGVKAAESPVIVFLDSHCECAEGFFITLLILRYLNHLSTTTNSVINSFRPLSWWSFCVLDTIIMSSKYLGSSTRRFLHKVFLHRFGGSGSLYDYFY